MLSNLYPSFLSSSDSSTSSECNKLIIKEKNVKGDLNIDTKDDFMKQFMNYSLEERRNNAERVLRKYKDKIPILVYRGTKDTPDIKNHKYLAPRDMKFHEFTTVIRKNVKLDSTQALFYFIKNESKNEECIPVQSSTLGDCYYKYCDNDSFLKIYYTVETTFG